MNLDEVTVELCPRSEWEAADLGARMIRRDAVTIYKVWFLLTLPLVLLTMLAILYTPWGGIALFLYWWLEPVTDGPILHVISRRLFGERTGVGAALRAAPGLAARNWIFLLPPYRFHLARSIAMPVTQLEGLRGARRRARARVLNGRILNFGIGVTVAYQHLALAVYFGVMLIIFALVPTAYQDSIGLGWMESIWAGEGQAAGIMNLLLLYAAQSVLHPWFVGAGFGLYINCRTLLEAWDIEVSFRRMVQRRASAMAAALLLVAASPLLFAPQPAHAGQDGDSTEAADPGFAGFWSDDEVRPALERVMADDALATTREIEVWRAIEDDEEAQLEEPRVTGPLREFLRALGWFFSVIVEFGLWIAAALLLFLLFATRQHWLPLIRQPLPRAARQQRVVLSGGEITAEQLPDDVPAEVRRLYAAGEKRRALSLLFRGSVFGAVTRHGVRLPPSATEGGCVAALTRQVDAAQSNYFRSVVRAWTWCAYGSVDPEPEIVDQLCDEWPAHYGQPA